jgi:hypothetical protein
LKILPSSSVAASQIQRNHRGFIIENTAESNARTSAERIERLGGFVSQDVEGTVEALSNVANARVQIRQEMSFVLA